jgi:hypothetical protein
MLIKILLIILETTWYYMQCLRLSAFPLQIGLVSSFWLLSNVAMGIFISRLGPSESISSR